MFRMIAFGSEDQDTNGAVILQMTAKSRLYDIPARVFKAKTLDGSSVITHLGFSHTDNKMKVYADITEENIPVIQNIFETKSVITVSTKDGFFTGVMDKVKFGNKDVYITVVVKEKIYPEG